MEKQHKKCRQREHCEFPVLPPHESGKKKIEENRNSNEGPKFDDPYSSICHRNRHGSVFRKIAEYAGLQQMRQSIRILGKRIHQLLPVRANPSTIEPIRCFTRQTAIGGRVEIRFSDLLTRPWQPIDERSGELRPVHSIIRHPLDKNERRITARQKRFVEFVGISCQPRRYHKGITQQNGCRANQQRFSRRFE